MHFLIIMFGQRVSESIRKTLILTACLVSAGSCAADEPTTTLTKLLDLQKTHKNFPRARLERDWIGDICDSQKNITRLRLEHGWVSDGDVQLLQMRGRYRASSEMPIYHAQLPQPESLKDIKALVQLVAILGKSKAFTTVWGDDEREHWTVGWTYFTQESVSRLRYLSVFARVSSPTTRVENDATVVDSLSFYHGVLRPANPDSTQEKELYPPGEALFLAEEAEKKKNRQAYPLPLRELLEVADREGSHLGHYEKHINSIRRNPDPKLFQQLISTPKFGSRNLIGHFEWIMIDSELPGIEPWKPRQRAIAVNVSIDSLSIAKDHGTITEVVIVLLQIKGPSAIVIHDGERGRRIQVNSNGYQTSDAKKYVPTLTETQAELRRMLLGQN